MERNAGRRFDKRFLNIATPWRDQRLLSWNSYTQTVYLDADNNRVPKDTPGAHKDELIPLALYGLDHPKIPILLVDFRAQLNPKSVKCRVALLKMSRVTFCPFRASAMSRIFRAHAL
jgi:hypothetical protein